MSLYLMIHVAFFVHETWVLTLQNIFTGSVLGIGVLGFVLVYNF